MKKSILLACLFIAMGCGSDGNKAQKDWTQFGKVCSSDLDCAAPTDFCAKWPMDAPTGICTVMNCQGADNVCPPSDWECFSPMPNFSLCLPTPESPDAGSDAS